MPDRPAGNQLLQAYRSTRYCVELDGAWIALRLDQALPAQIANALLARGHNQAAFLSAANPYSKVLDRHVNAKRHTQLLQWLDVRDIAWLRGSGQAIDRQWPAETSVLALGLAQAPACAIAEHFEQNAFVQIQLDQWPRLVLTEQGRINLN